MNLEKFINSKIKYIHNKQEKRQLVCMELRFGGNFDLTIFSKLSEQLIVENELVSDWKLYIFFQGKGKDSTKTK